MKVHELKTWPEYFEAIIRGVKTFEIRKNDRDFNTGDFLALYEYDPSTEEYTGREASAFVTYVMRGKPIGESFGIECGYALMAIELRDVRQ